MTDTHTKLAALVGSRLCHDLISPIGAIHNGLELLSLTNEGSSSPEMSLIEESCSSASARIRFFRVAFGQAGQGQNMSARDIRALFKELNGSGRITAEWEPGDDIGRDMAQLVFLAFLCAETALPMGGDIRITESSRIWQVTAKGPRVVPKEQDWSALIDRVMPEDVTPANVQFTFLSVMAQQSGIPMSAALQPDRVVITLG